MAVEHTHSKRSVTRYVDALQLRQSMGKVTESILLTGEPVLLEKARKLAAVIISIKDFQERFVEPDAAATLLKTIGSIDQISIDSTDTIPVNLILGKLRRD